MDWASKAETSRDTPTLELLGVTQLPENTNCLTCSEDGRFVSLGHSRGLSVWCASAFSRVAEWLQDGLEITSIQMSRIAERTYLLGTVDDMGVARVFALYSDDVHLLDILNTMEDITKRSIYLTFDVSEGGHYGAASISCSGDVWLEVYQFPLEAWLNELEMASSQYQDPDLSGQTSVNWSPVTLMIKVTPSESRVENPFDASRPTDFVTRCLSLDISSQKLSFRADAGTTKETRGSSRCCTLHFLLPCGHLTGDSKANHQPGLPDAVAVWWSGSHNLLQYLVEKSAQKEPDVAPVPDVLWPNAKEIVCSAVSRCTRYLALGLEDALVCVWDRPSGTPLSVALMPGENCTVCRMQFVDNWPASADDAQVFAADLVRVLLLCKSGSIYTVTAGQGALSCTKQLTERPKDSRDLPALILSVPFLRAVSLVVQKNGKMFLLDVRNQTPVCFLTPAASHEISTPCSPVCAVNAQQHTLLMRGDQDSLSCGVSSEASSQSQLFVFPFGKSETTKQFVVSHLDSPQSLTTLCHSPQEELCDLYLQQRVLSVEERNGALTQTWEKLQRRCRDEINKSSKATATRNRQNE